MGIAGVGFGVGYFDTAMYIGNSSAAMGASHTVGRTFPQESPLAPVKAVPEVYSNAQTERKIKTLEEMQHDREVAMAVLKGKSPRDAENLNPHLEKMIDEQLGKDGRAEEVQDAECETCENRKYVDGSNEGNVSFKSAQNIAPESAASRVLAHEYEHVRNAMREDQKEDAELVNVSVSLKTAICPECGKSYVSGGETRTTMRYTQGGESTAEQVKNNTDAA